MRLVIGLAFLVVCGITVSAYAKREKTEEPIDEIDEDKYYYDGDPYLPPFYTSPQAVH